MTVSTLLVQLLNGLASASSLFMVAAGLSLIFGVTRIVNFAHGSFYMLGLYLSYSLAQTWMKGVVGGVLGEGVAFALAIMAASVLVALFAALIEMVLLRRIYQAPELFQLLATFALVLVIRDAVLAYWGPEDLLGPRAPGLKGSVQILGEAFPQYDLALILIGPIVLGALWWVLTRTRWGTLIRAATQDREMVGALGVNQAWLFTSVFALGAFLAAFGGALQLPREPANQFLDLAAIGEAFVVVVVGGMGSIPGAFLAALMIAEIKAICIAIGQVNIFGVAFSFSKLTLVVEFLVMAAVLILKPWGLLGKPIVASRNPADLEAPMAAASKSFKLFLMIVAVLLLALPVLGLIKPYLTVLAIDILVAVLFAASLHFIMGPGGMHSFGHAAYFGLGAYGAALLVKSWALPMPVALFVAPLLATAGALLFGWFAVRLAGVYLAMLTLAFAQIVWSIAFQWDEVTGGSNGMVGVWPSEFFSEKWVFYYLCLACVALTIGLLWRILASPFGYTMRAGRDSPLRAEAIGIDRVRNHWMAFVIAGTACGLAGSLFAFSKGSIAPETISVGRSIDGLVMVMLGGVQTLVGPLVGASLFTWLQDTVARETNYWRAMLGGVILLLVLLFPMGVAGTIKHRLMQRVARDTGGTT